MRRLVLLSLLAACTEPDPVPLMPSDAYIFPDQGPIVDRGPDPDVAVDAEVDAVVDAVVDAMPPDGAATDADIGEPTDLGDGEVLDFAVDAVVSGPPPAREQIVVLSSRDDAWIAWIAQEALFAVRVEEDAEAADEPTRLVDVPGIQGPLLGFRLPRPWVLLPDGEGGMLRAHDLSGVDMPRPLDLWPPARVFVNDDEALIVGRSGPEPTALTGWRTMTSPNVLEARVTDISGAGLPQTVAYALRGWVLGYDGDTCADLTDRAAAEAPWLCQGRAGARLLGDGNSLFWLGATESGLRAWLGTPGAAVPAEGADPDGDGLVDIIDNCPGISNANQYDTDGDGIGDACQADDDRDGVVDDVDNCPLVRNPLAEGQLAQLDTDADGLGDPCDADRDADGLPNDRDNCPLAANPDQADGDGDRLGDACDMVVNNPASCPGMPTPDLDSDGVNDFCDDDEDGDGTPDAVDNCPRAKPVRRGEVNQADIDADGVGDLCDGSDRDADGVTDHYDTCPDQPNHPQTFGKSCAPPLPGRLTLVPGAAVVDWLAPPPAGHLLHIETMEGEASLQWVRRDRTHRINTPDPAAILGLFEIKTDRRLVGWSEPLNRPIFLPAELVEGPAPPRFVAPAGCGNVAPEICDDRDADCDGVGQGLCCGNNLGRSSTSVVGPEKVGADWFAGVSDEGLLMVARIGTVALQFSHPIGDNLGQRAREVARWEGVRRIVHFDNLLTRTALWVERDVPGAMVPEGQPVPTEGRVLWFRGAAGVADAPSPCADPVGITLLSNLSLTRVWCGAGGFDITPEGMSTPVAWPGAGGPVRWLEPNALGDENLFLAARGDDHQLQLWRMAADRTLDLADDPLPPEVLLLTPDERVVPVRLPVVPGGRTARIFEIGPNGAQRLEVVVPGRGWQPVPGSGWPFLARISRHDPVAVSAGYLSDPYALGADRGLLGVDFRLHSLRGDATDWGLPADNFNIATQQDLSGLGFGDYATGALDRPALLRLINRRAAEVTTSFQFVGVACDPF